MYVFYYEAVGARKSFLFIIFSNNPDYHIEYPISQTHTGTIYKITDQFFERQLLKKVLSDKFTIKIKKNISKEK